MQLTNSAFSLTLSDDALTVQLEDRARQSVWRIDPPTRRYYTASGGAQAKNLALPPGTVRQHDNSLVATHPVPGGAIVFTWRLEDDHVAVSLACEGAVDVGRIALPGFFRPGDDRPEIALPIYQGVQLRGAGATWDRAVPPGGHDQASMAMAIVLGQRASLLVTHENHANWLLNYGDSPRGPWFFFDHMNAPVDGFTGAAVRLYPCAPGLVPAAQQYRRVAKERGWFMPWSEKIARKPILKNLFGGLMTFIGYIHGDEVDYAGSARRLRAMGFENVFLYPVRMAQYSLNFKMGGGDPIWLSDEQIADLHAIGGVFVAPWAWVFEGLDDGSPGMHAIFRHNEHGPAPFWRIDDWQWYQVCPPYQAQHMEKRFATDLSAMDWLHYDVTCSVTAQPCLAPHGLHGSKPMGALDESHHNRRLLGPEINGNRIVCSEGFRDFFTCAYDIGTVKMLPVETPDGSCMPVPLTMLVYHDCMVHDWWEMHSYNENPGWKTQPAANGIGRVGSGEPHLKAAIDALYGCPPNVFPFGKQYAWVDKVLGRTFAFTMSVDDAPVQEALQAALPISRLHKRIGQCAMTDFEFLSADRAVQRTTFSDGTRIVANLGAKAAEVAGVGLLAPHSWRELQRSQQ